MLSSALTRARLASCVFVLPLAVALPAWAAPELALKRVMLSSGGVGYFEYEAEVEGAATLTLDVPLEQVDDVLKSLVVFDSAGNIGGLTLPGRDGARSAFGDVPFGPEALGSPVAYLNALQGVTIAVQGPRPMSGRVLRAEPITETIGAAGTPSARTAIHTRVSLLTDEGLRQFILEDAESIQVADPALRQRISRALDALRRAAGRDMRQLSLAASGTGKRVVRVGYVAAAPLWKASYRLVLPQGGPGGGSGKGRLQGWAVLENQTGQDWNGVNLTLQYGNPVTFRQAIYASYYVQRPEVPVQIMGRILPGIDTRARPASPPPAPAPAGGAMFERRSPAQALMAAGRADAAAPIANTAEAMAAPADQALATEGAEQTSFRLTTSISLTAGHSASVPILDQELDTERLGLVQSSGAHPLAAIRMTNSTGTSLPAGVLTLYDPTGEAAFAGDARLGGLPAGERRLLAFAEDLRTGIERAHSNLRNFLAVTAADGVLRISHRDRRVLRTTLTAPAQEPRRILLEIPRDGDRTLSFDGPGLAEMEQTATAWRGSITLKPGETRIITAWLDRIHIESISILPEDNRSVVHLLSTENLPIAARTALEKIASLRQDLAQRTAEASRAQKDLENLERNQERLRRNLGAVPTGDALHTRLLRQLDAEETRAATIRQTIEQSTTATDRARKTLTDAIAALRI